jgi:hypothetical protein
MMLAISSGLWFIRARNFCMILILEVTEVYLQVLKESEAEWTACLNSYSVALLLTTLNSY